MAMRVKINRNVKEIAPAWVLTEVFPKLNKTGLTIYHYLLEQQDKKEIVITYADLNKYNITKRQYQLGIDEL